MAKQKVIEVKNINKIFNLGKAIVKAVIDVSFDIYSGEFIIFFGPSGCGKSTLLNLIAGLDPPSSGRVIVRGKDLSKLNNDELAKYRRTKIGLVFQNYNLIRSMNTIENVAYPLMANGIPLDVRIKRATNLLEEFGLLKRRHNIPTELSGGEQQRVAICRALSSNPWILIADEPTGNLDTKSAKRIMDILYKQNRKSKRTVLVVTHNPEHLDLAHRIIYIRDGKIVKIQVNEDIRRQKKKHKILLEDLPNIGEEIAKRLEKRGYHEIKDIANAKPEELAKARGLSIKGAEEAIQAAQEDINQ